LTTGALEAHLDSCRAADFPSMRRIEVARSGKMADNVLAHRALELYRRIRL